MCVGGPSFLGGASGLGGGRWGWGSPPMRDAGPRGRGPRPRVPACPHTGPPRVYAAARGGRGRARGHLGLKGQPRRRPAACPGRRARLSAHASVPACAKWHRHPSPIEEVLPMKWVRVCSQHCGWLCPSAHRTLSCPHPKGHPSSSPCPQALLPPLTPGVIRLSKPTVGPERMESEATGPLVQAWRAVASPSGP